MRGPSLRITDVARRAGLSVSHCRALERVGDLPPPHREGGRCYWYAVDVAYWLACRAARKRRVLSRSRPT